jgi:hypothetical protein
MITVLSANLDLFPREEQNFIVVSGQKILEGL